MLAARLVSLPRSLPFSPSTPPPFPSRRSFHRLTPVPPPRPFRLPSPRSKIDYPHGLPDTPIHGDIQQLPVSQVELQKDEDHEEPQISKRALLWRAVKLPIYLVAVVPLSVGAAAAFWQTRVFHLTRFCLFLVSALLIIAWLNLSNDAYDAETGVDKGKKESVVNMTGSREGVLVAAYTCLVLGIIGLVTGSWQVQNMQVVALLLGAIACGYVYQCPPFRLSYQGLGEPLCFTAFGPLATTGYYLSQGSGRGAHDLPITGTILAAAVLVGITTTLILFCSHFHQIEDDKLVGKLSPLVRLGTQKGSRVVKAAVIGLYVISIVLTAIKALPFPCTFFVLLTLPIGRLVVDFVSKNHEDKGKIFLAKYYCVRLHAAFCAALVLGFLTAARLPLMTLQ